MLTLAINTASSKTAIVLLEDTQGPLAEESWQAHNNEAAKLLPAIAALLKRVGKSFSEIGQIIVVKGPGSFTGLRVGVTVANTLAYLNKAATYAVTTFEYWHAVSDLPLLVYAGSGGVYLSIRKDKTAELINLDQLYDTLQKRKITKVFGDISAEQKKLLQDIEFAETTETFGQIIAKILARIYREKRTPVQIVEPLYIKQPGITCFTSSPPQSATSKT